MSKKLPFSNSNIPKTEEEKKEIIQKASQAYEVYLDALGFDWRSDPNAKNTPYRVAKAFVTDLAAGCYNPTPIVTAFENTENYDGMVFQGDIDLNSICAHHHLPFIGKAYVAYLPSKDGAVVGLSKLNRIVDWFARRPQVQENLTMQIHDFLNKVLTKNKGVAVMIEAKHLCCKCRGIRHDSQMKTSKLSGEFLDDKSLSRLEFYNFINKR